MGEGLTREGEEYAVLFTGFRVPRSCEVGSLKGNDMMKLPLLRRCSPVIAAGILSSSAYANWDAAPLTVHEWGVNTFDWNKAARLQQDLPKFLYTDLRPGKVAPAPKKRVRDLPADSGVRTKPILYFYPGTAASRIRTVARPVVGVEMRFAEGYANAWWPQVHRYRTEEESSKAGPPNWAAWKEKSLQNYKKQFLGNNKDGKAQERWETQFANYQKIVGEDKQIKWLANRMRWFQQEKFPEDERMQLVWEDLSVTDKLPEGLSLPGKDLPDDHWLKVAREVDASYVHNGKEAERYVFYEGKTREEPAIALLPADGMFDRYYFRRGEDEREDVAVVNVGKHPIYDVIAVYRDSKKGILWTGHVSMLPALPSGRDYTQGDAITALRIPDFTKPREGVNFKMGAKEFDRRTRTRLLEDLTSGYHFDAGNVSMRDPADPQPPTRHHQLYLKEAVALERIWHKDFFEREGLTVLYREAPAYLDEAMPLNIFTSMFWYVKLSRCGLVLNRNLPMELVHENSKAIERFQIAQFNETKKEERENIHATLKRNKFLTMGQARFTFGRHAGADWEQPVWGALKGLFEE